MLGTLTFLNEIEYINPFLRSPIEKFVTLSPLGIPVSELGIFASIICSRVKLINLLFSQQISGLHREAGMTGGVGNPGMDILVAVGRAARMGRFIRTTVIVEYAAKFDFCQYFQPHHWLGEWRAMREAKKIKAMQENIHSSTSSRMPIAGSFGASTRHLASTRNLGTEKEIEPHQRKFFHDLATAVGISKQESEEHVRRNVNHDAYQSARQKRKKASQYSRDSSSHVGAAMRELTGQRVAIGVIIAILLNVLFTYKEDDGTPIMTMILLHGQTRNEKFANMALNIARSSVVPNLLSYRRYNESGLLLSEEYELGSGRSLDDIRLREMLNITIASDIAETYGVFDNRMYIKGGAMTVS